MSRLAALARHCSRQRLGLPSPFPRHLVRRSLGEGGSAFDDGGSAAFPRLKPAAPDAGQSSPRHHQASGSERKRTEATGPYNAAGLSLSGQTRTKVVRLTCFWTVFATSVRLFGVRQPSSNVATAESSVPSVLLVPRSEDSAREPQSAIRNLQSATCPDLLTGGRTKTVQYPQKLFASYFGQSEMQLPGLLTRLQLARPEAAVADGAIRSGLGSRSRLFQSVHALFSAFFHLARDRSPFLV